MSQPAKDEWKAALTRAAMPGAEHVKFSMEHGIKDGMVTTTYRLTSVDAAGREIGDDRDYDMLKIIMAPLETLARRTGQGEVNVSLDIASGVLSVSGQT